MARLSGPLHSKDLRANFTGSFDVSADEEASILLEINKSNEPVKQFVLKSLALKSKGDSFQYDQIVQQLKLRDDQDTLTCVYIALSRCASQFTNE